MTAAPEAPATGDILGDAIGGALDDLATDYNLPDDTGGEEAPLSADAPLEDAPVEDLNADGAAPDSAPAVLPEGEYPLSPDGSGYVLPKQDFDILKGQREYASAVQEIFPTANDAAIAQQEATDLRSMLADYRSGDQANIDTVLAHWAGAGETDPMMQRQFQQSFATMANRMPDTLKQINPQAYQQLTSRFIKEAGLEIYAPIAQQTKALYDKAAQTGDPTDFFNAQQYDFEHTKQYQTELKRVDPQEAQRQQIEARQREIESRENSLIGRDWANFNSGTVSGPKWTQYNSEIDRALETIKGNYAEPVFNAIRASVNQKLMAKLQDPANSEMANWARNHDLAYKSLEQAFKAAWRSGQPVSQLQQRIQFFQNDFLNQARKYLPSVVKEVIGTPSKAPATPKPGTPAGQQPRTQPAAARPAQPSPAARTNGQRTAAPQRGQAPPGWDALFRA
jgi:hypothetical protein